MGDGSPHGPPLRATASSAASPRRSFSRRWRRPSRGSSAGRAATTRQTAPTSPTSPSSPPPSPRTPPPPSSRPAALAPSRTSPTRSRSAAETPPTPPPASPASPPPSWTRSSCAPTTRRYSSSTTAATSPSPTKNILASATDNGSPKILLNPQTVSAPAEVFDAAVATLLNATSSYAAENSSRRFGTGEEVFDSATPTIYGLSQCTPDMSPDDCRSCLGGIIALIPQDLSRRKAGRVIGMRCNFRYEVGLFFSGGSMLRLPAPTNSTPPAPTEGRKKNKSGTALAIALPIVVVLLAAFAICFSVHRWRRRSRLKQPLSYPIQMVEDIESTDSLFIDLSTLRASTGNFSESNRLGEGGFGSVYKGVLPSGEEIAVKRLSMSSGQGIQELKNELVLVAKLQHKNLVRLVGVCLQEHEKLLVYEYMPNRSIDTILFDPDKRKELDWAKRFRIINGIARALQYLHEDSQLRIIHRDLKASNVLLDSDYTPKVSDFGLVRLFGGDQTREVTSRVVGTYGYMAPEYAMRGHYSVKSDVFSFGILMIEIVTGRRSSGSYSFAQSYDLLSLVWEHWTMGTILEMMDPSLTSHAPRDQMLKCVHIGLLCVQDNPADRPMMSTVNIMLSSNTVSLQSPSKPSFFFPKSGTDSNIYSEVGIIPTNFPADP